MIISHTHRLIFVHIQKTAGTSVTVALDPFMGWNDIILGGRVLAWRDRGEGRERCPLAAGQSRGNQGIKQGVTSPLESIKSFRRLGDHRGRKLLQREIHDLCDINS